MVYSNGTIQKPEKMSGFRMIPVFGSPMYLDTKVCAITFKKVLKNYDLLNAVQQNSNVQRTDAIQKPDSNLDSCTIHMT